MDPIRIGRFVGICLQESAESDAAHASEVAWIPRFKREVSRK